MARPAHVRSAVERTLEGSDRHGWSVDGLADALKAEGVDAGFSAVWRALRHLGRVWRRGWTSATARVATNPPARTTCSASTGAPSRRWTDASSSMR